MPVGGEFYDSDTWQLKQRLGLSAHCTDAKLWAGGPQLVFMASSQMLWTGKKAL